MLFEELKRMQRRVLKALRHAGSCLQRDLKGRDRFYRKVTAMENKNRHQEKEITTFTVTLMQPGNVSNLQSDRA